MYGEDIEWCWRLVARLADRRLLSGQFVHRGGSSARRSWGEHEHERRIAAGVDEACRSMYGPAHARALAALTGWHCVSTLTGARANLLARSRARRSPHLGATGETPMTRSPGPLASVVISTYNRAGALPATLDALGDQDLPPTDYEVLVVDDGSSDKRGSC